MWCDWCHACFAKNDKERLMKKKVDLFRNGSVQEFYHSKALVEALPGGGLIFKTSMLHLSFGN